jgi:hypothetical protein
MWTKEAIIEKVKIASRFWVPFVAGGLVLCFLIVLVMTEWEQTKLQSETLTEAKIVKQQQVVTHQNNELLMEVKHLQQQLLEIEKRADEQREFFVQSHARQTKNMEVLLENRELWRGGFEKLGTRLDEFKKDFDSHVGEWDRFKSTGKK